MGKVIVCAFMTLDGVIEDPDGSGGTSFGGWAFRYGPEAVAGDKFAMGSILDTGLLLQGRRTWELFGKLFPSRTDDFSRKLTAMDKAVVSHSLTSVDAWANSVLLTGDLVTEVKNLRDTRDVYVTGSQSVVDALREHDLVDQYRVIMFPLVVGQGRRLFEASQPANLELSGLDQVGPAVRLTYDRVSA